MRSLSQSSGSVLAVSASTFAVAVVAVLFAVFVLLLVGSLARARRSTKRPALAAEPGVRAGAPAAPAAAPKPRTVMSRRDFFRGCLLASLGVFTAQFGGTDTIHQAPEGPFCVGGV